MLLELIILSGEKINKNKSKTTDNKKEETTKIIRKFFLTGNITIYP